ARTRKGAVLAVVTAVVITTGAVLTSGTSSFGELLGSRLAELFASEEREFAGVGGEVAFGGFSGARKLTETYSVLAQFASGGFGEWIFGFGDGAEFEHLAPSSEVEAIYKFRNLKIHNIHNIVAAVLFRKGIVGVVVLTGLLVSVWREMRRIERFQLLSLEHRITVWTVKVYFVLS